MEITTAIVMLVVVSIVAASIVLLGFHLLLTDFTWFRKWKGGTWYRVLPRSYPDSINAIWTKRYDPSIEILIAKEVWL